MELTKETVSELQATLKTQSSEETLWLKEIVQAFLSLGVEPQERNAFAQSIVDALNL